MTKIENQKISEDLIIGAAMAMYANANEEGEINTAIADSLTAIPVGDVSKLSMTEIERLGFEEEMAKDRAAALARAALNGITVHDISEEPRRKFVNRLKKSTNPYELLTEDDFLPGGRIETVRSVGRITTHNKFE